MALVIGLLDSHKEERMSELRAMYQQAFDAFVKGDYEVSVAAYQRVIERDPRFGLAYQGLAEVYSRLNRLDDAIATKPSSTPACRASCSARAASPRPRRRRRSPRA